MITFNSKRLPTWVNVTGVSFQSSNLSVVEYDVKRRAGTIDAGVEKGGISISLDILIEPFEGLSILDQADLLKAFVMGDKWKVSKLILDEQPNKYYNARVSNFDEIKDDFTHGKTSIVFYCADPNKYDKSETVRTTSTNSISIPYAGMEKSAPILTLTVVGDCADIIIRHTPSNRFLKLNGNFKTGQIIKIDNSIKKVSIDNVVSMKLLDFTSNWIYLEADNNTIKTETKTASVTNKLSVTYTKMD